jgi:hypothetical protein
LRAPSPAQHPLLNVAKVPVAEWSEEVVAEVLEALSNETPSAKSLLAALNPAKLEALIEIVGRSGFWLLSLVNVSKTNSGFNIHILPCSPDSWLSGKFYWAQFRYFTDATLVKEYTLERIFAR